MLEVGSSNLREASFFFAFLHHGGFYGSPYCMPTEALIFLNTLSVIFTSLFLLLSEIVARHLHCKCNYFLMFLFLSFSLYFHC